MDKIVLVELIEGETAKLSPKGKGLWEEMEVLVELSSEGPNTEAQQAEISNRIIDELPLHDQHVIKRVYELVAGLYASDKAEEQGESGKRHRDQAVILAASLKDKDEGRQIDPDMTVDQAVARLRES